MGIARITNVPEKNDENKPILRIVEQQIEPVLIAQKKFYQTNPKEFLELALVFIFLLLTFIGELSFTLPWGWYIVFITFTFWRGNLVTKLKYKKKVKNI